MLEIKGREIRTSRCRDEALTFKAGESVEVRCDDVTIPSTNKCIQIDCKQLPPILREGDEIRLGKNSEITAEVESNERDSFSLLIKQGGTIGNCAPVKIPGTRFSELPIINQNDKDHIKDILIKHRFDYLVVPAVQSGRDLQELRHHLSGEGSKVHILARIDTVEAIQNFETIVKQADGVVLVRNELSFDLDAEKMVVAQKWMTQTANVAAVPVFLQSQILDSMIEEQVGPNARQETMDVSAAVLEGADVFVLSSETAVGAHAVEATVLLAKSIAEAENIYDHEQAYQEMRQLVIADGKQAVPADVLCSTATSIALDNNVDMFVCVTETGRVARQLAKQRPMQTILACSVSSNVVRQMNASRGVIGYKVPAHMRTHQATLVSLVLRVAKEQGFCLPGNKVMIFTCEEEGTPNETVNFKMIEIDEE